MLSRRIRERIAREVLRASGIKSDPALLLTAIQGRTSPRVRLLDDPPFAAAWARCERYLPAIDCWLKALRLVPDKIADATAPQKSEDLQWPAQAWFEEAQDVVALSQAFVIRSLLSRVLSGMTVASVSLALLLSAHLLYSFPGRATLLAVDWVALGITSLLAVRALLQMERNVVLSRLWDSTPGRLTFNKAFIQRIILYGALPLLTVISALFPELGDTLFGWLAPVRQLTGF